MGWNPESFLLAIFSKLLEPIWKWVSMQFRKPIERDFTFADGVQYIFAKRGSRNALDLHKQMDELAREGKLTIWMLKPGDQSYKKLDTQFFVDRFIGFGDSFAIMQYLNGSPLPTVEVKLREQTSITEFQCEVAFSEKQIKQLFT